MKKIIAIILLLSLALSLTGCDTEKTEATMEADKGYTQRRYVQEKINPPTKYDDLAYISISDYGVYTETRYLDHAGVMNITEYVLDNNNQLYPVGETLRLEPNEDFWSFNVVIRILDDGQLVALKCIVPRLEDGTDDWDNSYDVAGIIDWQSGEKQLIELGKSFGTASNEIMYDGENIGFYSEKAVSIYNTEGELISGYKTQNHIADACFMEDGKVAVLEYKQGLEASEEDLGQIFCFDPETGSAELYYEPQTQIEGLLDRAYDEEYFSFYIHDGNGIKGMNRDKQLQDVLNWVTAGVTGNATAMESTSGRRFAYRDVNGCTILRPTDVDMSQVTTLRLGTLDPFPIAGLVAEFNQTSENYIIEIVDYSKMRSDDGDLSGAELLDMEIVSGAGPDLLDLKSLPMKKYQQAGLLEDLYPYLEADESLSSVKLLSAPVKAMESDGKLYTLVPAYGISTFVGDPEYTGIDQLDIFNMAQLFGKTGEGSNPFGIAMSKRSFLDCMLNLSYSRFADWDSLKCNFDSPEFQAVLEMAKQLPEQEDTSNQVNMMYTGEQMLSLRNFLCINDLVVFNSYLHENMRSYGLPSLPEGGTAMMPLVALGISVNCKDKNGAWSLLSSLLSDDYQKRLSGQALPLTQAGLDYIVQDHMEWVGAGGTIITMSPFAEEMKIEVTDDRFVKMLQNAIDSISAICNNDSQQIDLVLRDAQAFFAGNIDVQKAAAQIQSRASIYMAEQYG